MDEFINKNITNELRTFFPDSSLEQMLTLYREFSQLQTPVETGICVDWIDNIMSFYKLSDTMRTSHNFLLNPESFFKKILYMVDEQAYNECNSGKKMCLYGVFENLGLLSTLPVGIRLDTYDVNRLANPVDRSIVIAYQLRNNASHTSENWSVTEMFNNINAIVAATLYAVWKHRNVITKHISSTTNNNQFGIDKLMKTIVKQYDQKIGQGFKYVPLLWQSDDNAKSKRMQISELVEDRHILLSGEAGCGKTTSLDYLEYQAAKNYISGTSNIIPVKIALIDESTDNTLSEMICKKLNIPANYCDELLKKNGIRLFIDGLNEFTSDMECKKQFVISIEQFVAKYPGIFVVVTDRRFTPLTIRLNKTYNLKRMSKQDILNYAQSRAENSTKVSELLNELLDKPNFADLEYTPLLVNQLLLAIAESQTIPSDLSELIGVYLEALMKREFEEKRELNAAPGKLDVLLMKMASEEDSENGILKFKALKLCTEIMNEYGIKIQADECINLAVQLGILNQTSTSIEFVLEEYRIYYLLKAMELGL